MSSCKSEELQNVKSVVEVSIKDSVQQEMSSYSDAVKTSGDVPNQLEISSVTIQKVMKTVADEESRARNIMIFGLPEKSTVTLTTAVDEVFSELGSGRETEVRGFTIHVSVGRRTALSDR